MLPQHVLSTQAIPAAFLPPHDVTKAPLVDFELGGVALNDSSEGLRVKTWRAEYIAGQVVISADDVAPIAVLTKAGLSSLSFTFDQNMRVAVAYDFESGAASEFYWFDNTVGNYVTLVLDSGSYSARCSLDDKRQAQGSVSDIILTYLRAGSLYFREQRDRYLVEYLLRTGLEGYELGQFGMNRKHRMQWQLVREVAE